MAILCVPIAPGNAHGQPSVDPSFNVRVYPLDVWNPRAGWGFGAGAVVHDLLRPGSQVLLTAAPAVHESVGTLSIASAHPYTADTYVVLDARAETTDRQWFYGLGPLSRDDAQIALDMNAWWTRLRIGQRLGSTPMHVQPHVTLMQHDVDGVTQEDPRALSKMSVASLLSIPGLPSSVPERSPPPVEVTRSRQLGIRIGIDLLFDTRDRAYGATRGVLLQAVAARYEEVLDQDLRFHRLDLRAHGFLPLGERHRLALALRTAITSDDGDAPIPFYLFPKLDGRTVPGWARDRFYGSDLVSARLLYRFPIVHFRDLLAVEGHVGTHVASVYHGAADTFTLDVSFDETLSDPTPPLRPAASAGLRIGPIFRDETYVDVAVGISPENVTGVRFTFVQPLRGLRPPHHHSPE